MKRILLSVLIPMLGLPVTQAADAIVTGATNRFGAGLSGSGPSTATPQARSEFIVGFNPAAPAAQGTEANVVVTGSPLFGGNFGLPVGFITAIDTNFLAVFTNQFGTNVVALPFAATNLGFGGRLPLGPVAVPEGIAPSTNSAPGPAPAVPSQVPTVNLPPAGTPPPLGQPGTPPTATPFPPTGRPLTPPVAIPPAGTPTPSPTPIPPRSTPTP